MKEQFRLEYNCDEENQKKLSLDFTVDHIEDVSLSRISDELLLFLHACGYTKIKGIEFTLDE